MLNDVINPMVKLNFLLIIAMFLSACFEIGKNEGTNEVLLNGSILKGTVGHGRLSLINESGETIWKGVSDERGKFKSSFIPANNQLLTLVVKSMLGGFIKCDASECEVPTVPPKVYSFGDLMPGSEVGDITLRSSFYLGDDSGSEIERQVNRQINGFSSLVINVVDDELYKIKSKKDFLNLTQAGSQVILSSLGLVVDSDVSLLELTFPDITEGKIIESDDSLIAILALLNASMSANLSFITHFSAAIVRYSSSMGDEVIQQELKDFQQALMTEAIALIDSGQVNVRNDNLLKKLQIAKDKGIDFSVLGHHIDDYFVAAGELPSEFTASSTHWGASDFKEAGQLWWVSEFSRNKEEWLQLSYLNSFIATQVDLGLSNSYPIKDAKLQGSNDGSHWNNIVDINSSKKSDGERHSIEHVSLNLNSVNAYKYYRFLVPPIEAVLLEYFCLYDKTIEAEASCEASKSPVKTEASSYKFSAENINNNEAETFWISELASGKEEWVQVTYEQPFLANQVLLVIKQSYQGAEAKIQGSNEGTNWELIESIKTDIYPNETIDAKGFRHINLKLNINTPYRYFRYISTSNSFILLSELRFK